jgi:hypothetical protein
MLLYLSDEVRGCCLCAKACARNANAESDPRVRQSFLDTEKSCSNLAKFLARLTEIES